jgi:hypothetical protein
MSAVEAYLCQHVHLLPHVSGVVPNDQNFSCSFQYMIELQTERDKVSQLLFWNEHENVFWKWMVLSTLESNAIHVEQCI